MKADTAACSELIQLYKFKNQNGKLINPSKNMFSSWVHTAAVMRNICAHNGRIYNRVINTSPELIKRDKIVPQPKYNGLYQILMAMKYLRPNDTSWGKFAADLKGLIIEYSDISEINRLNFPPDWEKHLKI